MFDSGMSEERIEELLELYVLGGLEPEAAARVEAALAHDPALRRAAEELQRTTAQLLEAAPEILPAPRIKAQLMKRVWATRPTEARSAFGWWQRLAPGLALAALVAIIGLGAWNVSLQQQVQALAAQNATTQAETARLQQLIAVFTTSGVQVAQMGDPNTATALAGETYWNTSLEQALFVVHNLPPAPEGKTYQLWLIGPDGAVSVGLLSVDTMGRGYTLVSLTATSGSFSAAGISLEPMPGSPQPTDVILVGNFNS